MIIAWIVKVVLWALVGWGAGKIMGGKPNGVLMNILLGIVGGAVGSFLCSLLGLHLDGVWNIVASVAGACLVLFVVKKIANK